MKKFISVRLFKHLVTVSIEFLVSKDLKPWTVHVMDVKSAQPVSYVRFSKEESAMRYSQQLVERFIADRREVRISVTHYGEEVLIQRVGPVVKFEVVYRTKS